MATILLVKGTNREGYWKAKETSMCELRDLLVPNTLEIYNIDMVR